MTRLDRTRSLRSTAAQAGAVTLALTAILPAASNADTHTVAVEVAFVDRIEIEHEPKPPEDQSIVAAASASDSIDVDGDLSTPLARLNVVTTPGRVLTAQVQAAGGEPTALPDGLLCSFGNQRGIACDADGVTVTSATDTEFRLDRGAALDIEADAEVPSPTVLDVTIAYQ